MSKHVTNKQLLLTVYKDIRQLKTQRHNQIVASIMFDNADVKRYLNISDSTLYRLRTQKAIPFIKIGKKYYYPRLFFEQLLGQYI